MCMCQALCIAVFLGLATMVRGIPKLSGMLGEPARRPGLLITRKLAGHECFKLAHALQGQTSSNAEAICMH